MRCLVRVLACAHVLGVTVLVSGCPDRSISEVQPVQQGVHNKVIPVNADIDILFVIDNSASTRDKQTLFARNYLNFVAALDRFPTGRPNLHLAVVTSTVDIGGQASSPCHPAADQNGTMQNASRDPANRCTQPTDHRFLSDITKPGGGRQVNYTGTLDQALSCISHVNDNGCGFEAPLEAMKRALDGSHPENADFLRPGAFLAVVILSDEDDCSARPQLFTEPTNLVGRDDFRCTSTAYRCAAPISPSTGGSYSRCEVRRDSYHYDPDMYAQFLASIKDPSLIAVAVIAGEPTTSLRTGRLSEPFQQDLALLQTCETTIDGKLAIGRPALRLDAFARSFGPRGLFRSVCQADYGPVVADIGALLFQAISPCLEGELDTRDLSPTNPGLQPDCSVVDVQGLDTADESETIVPRCRMLAETSPDVAGVPACWWVEPNPTACRTETTLELHVERSVPAAPNTAIRVSCATGER